MVVNSVMNRFIDYHVHTLWSDGYCTPEQIIQAGTEIGLKEVCLTDHYSNFKPALTEAELSYYFKALNELKSKYKNSIKVFIGIEVDMISIPDLKSLSLIEWDLVLFEYVFNTGNWQEHFNNINKFTKTTGIQTGLAHTRFTRIPNSKFDSVLVKILNNNIAIELNTGYQNYRDKWFKSLDDEYLYSIGSDAHDIVQLGDVSNALSFLETQSISQERILKL